MNLEPLNLCHTRLQALDWLFRATRPWLLQGQGEAEDLPQANDVDWKAVGDLAHVHNLEPLLFWTVSTHEAATDLPVWLKEKWEQAYFEAFLKNEERLHVLEVLLDKWREEGVSVIVLKGPALIGRIYRDPALRPMSDLDILCSEKDLGIVVDMAGKMGYRTGAVGDDPASTQHVAMHHVKTGSLLEFHFRPYDIIRDHPSFMEMAWQQRERVDVNTISCPVLSLEMELLFDLAHLAHHQFDVSLKHLVDIVGLLVFCKGEFHWNETKGLLRQFGLERVFELTTGFLSHMLRLPQLDHLPWNIQENNARKEFDASLRDLLALMDQARLMDIKGVISGFRVALRNQEGFRERLLFVRSRLFPFLDAMASQYNIHSKGDIFHYYVQRILFYFQRFLLTLTHFPRPFGASNRDSPAAQRAAAKNRVTRQLAA
jgi:hypothetical protein